jgi:hypothetical protein
MRLDVAGSITKSPITFVLTRTARFGNCTDSVFVSLVRN